MTFIKVPIDARSFKQPPIHSGSVGIIWRTLFFSFSLWPIFLFSNVYNFIVSKGFFGRKKSFLQALGFSATTFERRQQKPEQQNFMQISATLKRELYDFLLSESE